MAYRRSIVSRASLLTRLRPTNSPFPYISDDRERRETTPLFFNSAVKSPFSQPPKLSSFLFQFRYNNNKNNNNNMMFYYHSNRNMSTSAADVAISDKSAELITDIADVAASSVGDVAVMSEVAIAAADSAFPVAALQYLIEAVHNFSGCNWWASIALTTLLIRGATVPLLINQLKSTTKLSMLRPHLDAIKEEMQGKGMDPDAVADGQKRMQALFKQYGVTPFTPLKGLLVQGPVFLSFFLAISNMVEKVPSFKQGGVFWFTDLSTPDSLYIFPALAALSFWITVECNMQEGMEGNPAAKTMKKISRVFAAVTIPITMNFPKALFCYWVTSNMFSLMYGLVLKAPGVKQFLKIPKIPVAPPSSGKSSSKPEFSFIEAMKQYVAAKQNATKQLATSPQHATSSQQATPLLSTTSKPTGIQNVPSSAVLSQRLNRLERQVKAKKKNKKR